MDNNYFLVLTKKKNYSREDERKIFLNKYYCGYDYDFEENEDILLEENMDFDFMPQINELMDKLVPIMADCLNLMHGLDYSNKFWNKILCFWWLPDLLRNVYIKYHRIQYLIERYGEKKIRVPLLHPNEWDIMMDVSDYYISFRAEKHNLQIWTKVIEHFTDKFVKEYIRYGVEINDGSTRNEMKKDFENEPLSSNRSKFIERLLNRMRKDEAEDSISNLNIISNFINRSIYEKTSGLNKAKCFIFQSGFSDELFDKIVATTMASARPIPNEIVSRDYRRKDKKININKRDEFKENILRNLEGCHEDDKAIINIVLDEIPMCYIELFEDIRKQYLKYLLPNICYLISQHGAIRSTSFLLYAAEMNERFQTKLLGIQHGGNYQTEWLLGDYQLSDKMYCWGKIDMDNKFIASAPYKLEQYPKIKENNTDDKNYILYVDNSYMPYATQNEPVLYECNLIKESISFFNTINEVVKDNMRVRKYTDEYGWDIEQIIKNHVQGIHFDRFNNNLEHKEFDFLVKIRRSSICVFNILSTGWLEALALNKPFVAFFHEHMFPLRESEKSYMDALFEVQILHHSGESAARLLNEIHNDVSSWWNESRRQSVVNKIRERYWNDFGDPNEWWLKEIQSLVKR